MARLSLASHVLPIEWPNFPNMLLWNVLAKVEIEGDSSPGFLLSFAVYETLAIHDFVNYFTWK